MRVSARSGEIVLHVPEAGHCAMLDFLNKRKGLKKVILWAFIGMLVLGLAVVFAAPSTGILGRYGPAPTDGTVVAEVGGLDITLGDLKQQIRNFGRSKQTQSSPRTSQSPDAQYLYPAYGKQAIESLINARVVRLEANNLGLGATTEEMQERIVSMFSPDGRWVGQEAYQRYLRGEGLTVHGFESGIADSIIEEKLRNYLTAGLSVSEDEIREDYVRTNTTMTATYVLVAPKVDADAPVSDEELRAYFDSHSGEFRIDVQQRKITYLYVSQDAVGAALQIPDEELRQEFDAKKIVSAVHVAQIVFKVPKPEEEAAVRAKAQGIADRAKGTAEKPAEDFATLATGNSQDPETAKKGGDAGWIEKGTIKPGDSRERLFNLEKDQVTAPLKVGESYVIYKVLDRREKTFEEAREELLVSARNRKAYSRGVEIATQAEERLRGSKDPAAVARQLNEEAGAPADRPIVSVRETPFVQPGDQIPDIGANPQFEDTINRLSAVGDIGPKVGVTGGFAVPMLVEIREPHDAAFDEVKDRVTKAFRDFRAREQARVEAERLATAANPEELKARAKAAGLEPKTQPNFRAGGALPDMQASDLIDQSLLKVPDNSVGKTPVSVPAGYVVLAVADRKEADMGEAFKNQHDSIRDRLLSTKQSQYFDAYMKNRRKQLEDAGEIIIYQDLINYAFEVGGGDEDESPVVPPGGTTPPRRSPIGAPDAAPGGAKSVPGVPGGPPPAGAPPSIPAPPPKE
jgi:peptidyl-prolyl cis-trans isomerase D